MAFDRSDYIIVRASDVSTRDGIGVEITRKGKFLRKPKFLCEIFRDDSKRTRTVYLESNEISLEELEGFIQIFKQDIDWEYIDDDYPQIEE